MCIYIEFIYIYLYVFCILIYIYIYRQLGDDEVKRRQDELLRKQGLKQQPSKTVNKLQSKDSSSNSSIKKDTDPS
jgi:hypothetical protein